MSDVLPRACCRHRLPVSNGYSGSKDEDGWRWLTVWCGYCHAHIDALHDEEWAERYQRTYGYHPVTGAPPPEVPGGFT